MKTAPQETAPQKDNEYYRSLMQQLYASKRKKVQDTLFPEEELDAVPAQSAAEVTEVSQEETPAPEQEVPEPEPEEPPTRFKTFLEKAKEWLLTFTNEE